MSRSIRLPAVFALLPLFAACGPTEAPVHEDLRPVRSTIVGESRGSVGATYSGQVQARHEVKLGFQLAGRISARLAEVGMHVRRGEVLMRLDPQQETLHLAAADAGVAAARSRVEQNRVDLARSESTRLNSSHNPASRMPSSA
jgi:multidrug efflux pump subunit AcrA (membrane-fusion protein)